MKSSNNAFELNLISVEMLGNLVAVREGETKAGQKMKASESLADAEVKYVVLGISEDIGPQSNGGFPGSDTAFSCFVKRFVNVQSNAFFSGDSVGIIGEIKSLIKYENAEQGRKAVAELDDFVVQVLTPYVESGLIPIVIGGGHNNAFPLIKTVSQALEKSIGVINFDPHADFRPLEGRHSGNPFSYAFHETFMDFYAVFGLHQNYNSQFILDELAKNEMLFSFQDDYLSGVADFQEDLEHFFEIISQKTYGMELDMDSIAYMPSSAFSPSGMTLEQARKYVIKLASSTEVAYFHLPEAAPKNSQEEAVVGKALTYLVTDFIKSNSNAG